MGPWLQSEGEIDRRGWPWCLMMGTQTLSAVYRAWGVRRRLFRYA